MGQRKHRQRQLKCMVLGAAGAGKTSLLRRYFYRHFNSDRAPTVGADFYVGRVPQKPEPGADADQEDSLYVQMWDTPGKENFAIRRKVQASLNDSFFEHADAIMLVYDMTSSTSFTRLLKWYADLLELFARKSRSVPILLVANKLDLFEEGKPRQPPKQVPQREVLGLGRSFYGHDFHYEYSVSPPKIATDSNSDDVVNPLNRTTKSSNNKRRMEISNYFLVNRDNWTSDFSYLESLIMAEDGSHPDREMVLLWCMRNSLSLYEVSAATGEGVEEAVQALVSLANGPKLVSCLEKPNNNTPQRNEELDVRNRYAPEKTTTCFFSILPVWRKAKDNPPSW